jgi:hypothetical protein
MASLRVMIALSGTGISIANVSHRFIAHKIGKIFLPIFSHPARKLHSAEPAQAS